MPRTNSTDVLANFHADSSDVDSAAVDDAIGDAHSIVNNRLGGEFDDGTLERIEKLVARHFLTQSNPALSQFNSADSSGTFEGQTGSGWTSTRYGQRALELSDGGLEADNYVVTREDV